MKDSKCEQKCSGTEEIWEIKLNFNNLGSEWINVLYLVTDMRKRIHCL